MPNHLLNLALLLQIVQRFPCQAAIDLQPVHKRGDRDEAVGLHVFVEFVRGGFVEDDGVVGLVLDCWRKAVSARAREQCIWGSRGDAEGLEDGELGGDEGATYPCPLTTSSFASCRQMLLRVPGSEISFPASALLWRYCAHHDCGCWKMVVVVVDEVRSMRIECGA